MCTHVHAHTCVQASERCATESCLRACMHLPNAGGVEHHEALEVAQADAQGLDLQDLRARTQTCSHVHARLLSRCRCRQGRRGRVGLHAGKDRAGAHTHSPTQPLILCDTHTHTKGAHIHTHSRPPPPTANLGERVQRLHHAAGAWHHRVPPPARDVVVVRQLKVRPRPQHRTAQRARQRRAAGVQVRDVAHQQPAQTRVGGTGVSSSAVYVVCVCVCAGTRLASLDGQDSSCCTCCTQHTSRAVAAPACAAAAPATAALVAAPAAPVTAQAAPLTLCSPGPP